ncbi:MAG: class I SAM-dependent methyltransferase [Alphaproteobacteria bacterium]|nr:class I SAM-dependent methyltransferase [Alphaproteobacteria bacterium]
MLNRLCYPCPVCAHDSRPFDVVDFNKSCLEQHGTALPLSGEPVYYFFCPTCGFTFAPELCAWPWEIFERKIYNEDYAAVDPSFRMKRPHQNHEILTGLFSKSKGRIRHLDFGGGNGFLSKLLKESGWDTQSYDPVLDKGVRPEDLGQFDLVTAFEVFEHVPDVNELMGRLKALLKPSGLIYFSTMLSDRDIVPGKRLTWWYVAPRNGHISLFSMKSLAVLAGKFDLNYKPQDNRAHFLWSSLPDWAAGVV